MKRLVLMLVMCAVLLSGCVVIEVDPESESTSGAEVATDDIGVEMVELTYPEWRGVGALLTNNGESVVVGLEIQFLFYNADGQIIATETIERTHLLPAHKVSAYTDAPDEYDRVDYKVRITDSGYTSYENLADSMKVEANKGENGVIVQITNDASAEIEVLVCSVVLYRNEKIVDMGNGLVFENIGDGETIIEEWGSFGIEYDSYEVLIHKAMVYRED